MGKNIVVFLDGTGQKGGVNNNTNVYNLFNSSWILEYEKREIVP